MVIPALCIAEVAHLAGSRRGVRAELRLLEALIAGSLFVEQLHPADLARAAELVAIYRDLPLGTVDAPVVAAAERLDVTPRQVRPAARSARSRSTKNSWRTTFPPRNV